MSSVASSATDALIRPLFVQIRREVGAMTTDRCSNPSKMSDCNVSSTGCNDEEASNKCFKLLCIYAIDNPINEKLCDACTRGYNDNHKEDCVDEVKCNHPKSVDDCNDCEDAEKCKKQLPKAKGDNKCDQINIDYKTSIDVRFLRHTSPPSLSLIFT